MYVHSFYAICISLPSLVFDLFSLFSLRMNEEDDCEDVDQESEKVSTSDLLSDIEFDIERLEFDNAEREIVDEMQNQGLYRLSCFSHTLQLVLAYFDICRKRKRFLVIYKSNTSANN